MTEFQEKLKHKMKEELFVITSQFRRAALSVVLNYIEGFARFRQLVQLQFCETSYGSLKEADYLLGFVFQEGFIQETDYIFGRNLSNEIGAMLWTEIESLRKYNR